MLVALLSLAASASAQTTTRRTPVRADAPQITFAAAVSVGVAGALFLGDVDMAPRWGGNPFDDAVRDGLRLSDADARRAIGRASDVLLGAMVLNGLVDALAVPLLQGDSDLAWQATAAYALTMGVTLTLNEVVKHVAARERPIQHACDSSPLAPGCDAVSPGQSFYSGHASTSFASAGFSCAMHLEHSLYGEAGTDRAACGSSLLAAVTVGLFRVMADQHYLTDVLVGAAIGWVTGYLIPMLLVPHRRGEMAAHTTTSVLVLPAATLGGAGIDSLGLNAMGAF